MTPLHTLQAAFDEEAVTRRAVRRARLAMAALPDALTPRARAVLLGAALGNAIPALCQLAVQVWTGIPA